MVTMQISESSQDRSTLTINVEPTHYIFILMLIEGVCVKVGNYKSFSVNEGKDVK